ncbi:MAG: LysE family translocator [Albidovulum sp.]
MITATFAEALAAFAVTSFVIELTPGPNMAWLAIVSISEGRRSGYAAVAGVALGLSVIGIAAALGLAALIAASPVLFQTLRWGGVAYLLWLAWDGWKDADAVEDQRPYGLDLRLYFQRGLITNLLNPKAALFYVAVLPSFTTQTGPVLNETLALSAVYVSVATGIHFGLVSLAAQARRILDSPTRRKALRRGLSLLLAVIALWFAWSSAGVQI